MRQENSSRQMQGYHTQRVSRYSSSNQDNPIQQQANKVNELLIKSPTRSNINIKLQKILKDSPSRQGQQPKIQELFKKFQEQNQKKIKKKKLILSFNNGSISERIQNEQKSIEALGASNTGMTQESFKLNKNNTKILDQAARIETGPNSIQPTLDNTPKSSNQTRLRIMKQKMNSLLNKSIMKIVESKSAQQLDVKKNLNKVFNFGDYKVENNIQSNPNASHNQQSQQIVVQQQNLFPNQPLNKIQLSDKNRKLEELKRPSSALSNNSNKQQNSQQISQLHIQFSGDMATGSDNGSNKNQKISNDQNNQVIEPTKTIFAQPIKLEQPEPIKVPSRIIRIQRIKAIKTMNEQRSKSQPHEDNQNQELKLELKKEVPITIVPEQKESNLFNLDELVEKDDKFECHEPTEKVKQNPFKSKHSSAGSAALSVLRQDMPFGFGFGMQPSNQNSNDMQEKSKHQQSRPEQSRNAKSNPFLTSNQPQLLTWDALNHPQDNYRPVDFYQPQVIQQEAVPQIEQVAEPKQNAPRRLTLKKIVKLNNIKSTPSFQNIHSNQNIQQEQQQQLQSDQEKQNSLSPRRKYIERVMKLKKEKLNQNIAEPIKQKNKLHQDSFLNDISLSYSQSQQSLRQQKSKSRHPSKNKNQKEDTQLRNQRSQMLNSIVQNEVVEVRNSQQSGGTGETSLSFQLTVTHYNNEAIKKINCFQIDDL
ncbi:UNKNOWN [Stylonychia lemnae]|uniref:Uncharacterized protein n=1 Tax=Stylonychia lemnae TaxID=5949 RepID=A0A078AWQ7_STYLE|nr:UNKNOWN [Stylonychia lemnae]|eukprot:CDW85692.1 UNKNOWN [Stylonychia lemnae]